MRKSHLFIAAVALAAVLAGSPTAVSAPAGKVKPSATAQQLMTTVVTLQRWAEFLYGLRAPTQACEPFVGEPIFDEEAFTLTQETIDEDCTHVVTTFFLLDGGYTQELTYVGGLVELVEGFVHLPEAGTQLIEVSHEFSNGHSVVYDILLEVVEIAPGFFIQISAHWDGELRFGGDTVHFSLDREFGLNGPPADLFRAEMPAGTEVTLEVPLDPFTLEIPDFFQASAGELEIQGKSFPFELHSDEPEAEHPRWTRLKVGNGPVKGKSPNGEFLIGADFSGRGQMFRGKKLDFIARWGSSAVATVILPNGQATSAGPVAGLLDFAQLRWSGVASSNGPTPGF
jgi:hypothetical protein